jgi:hypothetical protein
MVQLKITLKENRSDKHTKYYNKINPNNFKELSVVLEDLKNLGFPINKAIRELNQRKSDWDAALRL